MRALGLDVGVRRTGIALSDETRLFAQPLTVVPAAGAVDKIVSLCAEHQVSTIVIGLPLSLGGGDGGISARRAKKIGDQLDDILDVEIIYLDERFTTAQADRLLIEADVRRDGRKQVVDKIAAALILQGYLDAQTNKKEEFF